MNKEIAYIFTGRKVVEKKIIKFSCVEEGIVLTKIEEVGFVVFENTLTVKKGELKISLDKNLFKDVELEIWKNEKIILNREIQKLSSQLNEAEEKVIELKNTIAKINTKKEHLLRKRESLKEKISNKFMEEYRVRLQKTR